MNTGKMIVFAKGLVVLSVIPALIFAYVEGPDPRLTGAPGDQTCAACHLGTAVDGGPGKVEIVFPGGLTYTPGVSQRLTVKVTGNEPRARYGFQATARLAGNLQNGQAGTFAPVDGNTQVVCEDGSPRASGGSCGGKLEFVQHTQPGTGSDTFNLDWTPPAEGAGDVRIYVAGNAANGNGQNTGDKIYTANYTLTSGGASRPKPTIRSSQPVLQAFSGAPALSAGTWIEIYGTDLSAATRDWAAGDFKDNRAPTTLEGVSVTINDKPAFIRYVSPGQVNAQAPDDDAEGPVAVRVTNANGAADPINVDKSKVSPALLTTPRFKVDDKQYAAALFPDLRTFVGRENLFEGASFRPAMPGDSIVLFAVGCGPADPTVPAGTYVSEARPLALPFEVTIGDQVAETSGFLAGGALGLCQFHVKVPNLGEGDAAVSLSVNGVKTGQALQLTIKP